MSNPNEFLLNPVIVKGKTNSIFSSALEMRMYRLSSYSSQSTAIDEFVDVFNDFSSAINDYLMLLNNNLKDIDHSVDDVTLLDRKLSGGW